MTIPETERELFSYLRSLTRDLARTDLSSFTTSGMSRAISISRNLASHYLNDLVRAGAVVKAGTRPVYYFARKDLERYLQAPVERASFGSVEELLSLRDEGVRRDFEQAVGHDLSLASAIEKLKAAIAYPPNGLPVLLFGAKGTGKTLLSSLACSYGRRVGALSQQARFVSVDCTRYQDDPAAFARDFLSEEDGLVASASGGVVALRDADRLSLASQELLLERLSDGAAATGAPRPRFVFLTTRADDAPEVATLVRAVPVIVRVPTLHERSAEEREEFVLSLFKEEGRRLGVDVFVSRAAFTCLVEADFKDNVQGLSSCITSCCASAYLDHASERLEVQAFLLPGSVLDAAGRSQGILRSARLSAEGDSELIDTTRSLERTGDSRSVRAFSAMLEAFRGHLDGSVSVASLVREVLAQVRDYEDYLAFDAEASSQRAAAYERILADISDDVNAVYGINLSKKSARVIARCIHTQVHPGSRLSKWRASNQSDLAALLTTLLDTSQFGRLVTERVASEIERTLGVRLDVLTRIFVFAVVREADRRALRRQSVGIVVAHGYSTATSIADACNRILRQHVFEALDMTYDQQVKDIVGPLRDLLDTYAFCREVAILVDMGSLEQILEDVGEIANVTIGVANNVSTALALEVGAGLVAGEPLSALLPAAAKACANRCKVVEAPVKEQAVAFCSEGGAQAAERIKSLIERSLEVTCPLRFVTCSPQQLQREGITTRYEVLAVIGTDDPCAGGIPFIALEDIISGERSAGVDEIFARFLDADELERFHQNLVKSLTLRNVIESITILNPEKVLKEVEAAVERMQSLMGRRLAAPTMIGLCVHLCCLIERLVTRNPIESYVDVESFESEHADFIDLFEQSFSDIASHYNVEVPVAEIAYAYDYVHQKSGRQEVKR